MPFQLNRMSLNQRILAIPTHVAILVAPGQALKDNVSAPACLGTLEIRPTADRNVWSILNVNKIWHVSVNFARLLAVLKFVEPMLNATLSTTMPSAHAYLGTNRLLMLSLVVKDLQLDLLQ